MLPVPFMSSYMVDRAQQMQYGEHDISQIQEAAARQMAESLTQAIVKGISMTKYERPSMNATEYRMTYTPDVYTGFTPEEYERSKYYRLTTASDSSAFTYRGEMVTQAPALEVPKPVERSFFQWYRELKSEIDRWLN